MTTRPGHALRQILDDAVLSEYKSKQREYTHVYPSSIGKCIRCCVYERLISVVDKIPPDAKLLRVFSNGNYFHERLYNEMLTANILVAKEARMELPKFNITGSVDCICIVRMDNDKNVLVIGDGKSAKDSSFAWQRSRGPDEKYVDQMVTYLYAFGIKYGILIYENKNDQEREYFDVELDIEKDTVEVYSSDDKYHKVYSGKVTHLTSKAQEINKAVQDNVIPSRPPHLTEKSFECKYCDYNENCWEAPEQKHEFKKITPKQ